MGMAMCASECPSAETCYRKQRKPNEYRQAFMAFTPDIRGRCDFYVEAISKSQVKRLDEVTKDDHS